MKILIPAYQPDKKLIKLIKDLKKQTDMSIIVVDDGSGEKYQNIFNWYSIIIQVVSNTNTM